MSLVWFCKNCHAKEPVEPTGDERGDEYEEGDSEPCIDCGHICRVYNESDIPEILKELADEEAEEVKEHDFSKGVRGKYVGRT